MKFTRLKVLLAACANNLQIRARIGAQRVKPSMLQRNSLLNLGSGVVPLLALIICVPLIEDKFGLSFLTSFILLSSLVTIFGTLDFGISRNIIIETFNKDCNPSGLPDEPFKLGRKLSLTVTSVLSTFFVILGIVFYFIFTNPNNYVSAALFCLAGSISLPTLCYRSLLEVRGQFIRLNVIRSIGACIIPASPLLAPEWSGQPLLVSSLIVLATRAALLLAYHRATRIAHTVGVGGHSRQEKIRFLKQSNHIGLANIVSLILVYGDRYLIAVFLGGMVAGQYALAYDTVAVGWVAVGALMSASLPSIGAELYGQGKAQRAHSGPATRAVKRMIMWLMVVPGGIAIVLAPSAYNWWIGSQGEVMVGQIASILIIGLVLSGMSQLNLALLQVAGGAKISGQLQLLNLAIAVLLLAVLLPTFGILGAALAFSTRLCADALLIRYALNRQLGPRYGFQLIELIVTTFVLTSIWVFGVFLR